MLIPFIQNTYIPDVAALASYYPDYYNIGRGAGNLLAYGVFDLDGTGSNKLLRSRQVSTEELWRRRWIRDRSPSRLLTLVREFDR